MSPVTFETQVTYGASSLPAGVTVPDTSNISAEIVGIPTEIGTFNAVVTGTAHDGETEVAVANSGTANGERTDARSPMFR